MVVLLFSSLIYKFKNKSHALPRLGPKPSLPQSENKRKKGKVCKTKTKALSRCELSLSLSCSIFFQTISFPLKLSRGSKPRRVREPVVHRRGREVLGQVGDRALAGHDGLHEEAEHRHHGQAPVFDLFHLELGELVGVVCEAQGVEAGARVEPVEVLVLEPGGSPGDAVVFLSFFFFEVNG